MLVLLGLSALFSLASETYADEYRPAYLQIQEIQPNTFDVLWKVPALGDRRLSLYVAFPENAEIKIPARSAIVSSAFIGPHMLPRGPDTTGPPATFSLAAIIG